MSTLPRDAWKYKEDEALQSLLNIDAQYARADRAPLEELSRGGNTICYSNRARRQNGRRDRLILPKLNTSKDDLKMILRKLESLQSQRMTADLKPFYAKIQGSPSKILRRGAHSENAENRQQQNMITRAEAKKSAREKTKTKRSEISMRALTTKTLQILNEIHSRVRPDRMLRALGRQF